MNKENLKLWIGRHFYQPIQENKNEMTVSCPFHSDEDNNCKCHINIDTQKYYCDKMKSPKDIKKLFNHFHEDYPKDNKFIQINNHYYNDKRVNHVVTLVEREKANGKKIYYQRPKGVKKHVLFNLTEVLKTAEKGEPIVWVVGEQLVKELKRYGITATTTIGGVQNYDNILDSIKDLPKGVKILFYGNKNPKYNHYFETVGISLFNRGITPNFLEEDLINFNNIDYWIQDGNHKLEEVYRNSKVYIYTL